MGMEEKLRPGDDCGKRQMERESKTPTSLIGTLETGRERERLLRTPVPVLRLWIDGPPVQAYESVLFFVLTKG